jgi:cytochrome c oxidase assembly protein subunit 15
MTSKFYQYLILTAVILALFVVGVGAYTRLTNAGLGCPDWPGCYGTIVPSAEHAQTAYPQETFDNTKAWTEMVHRYFAGALVLLIVSIVVYSWRHRLQNYPLRLPFCILLLVGFQALLGMWTVTLKLQPTIVMAHLLGGLTTLSLLWLLWLQARAPQVMDTIQISNCVKRFGHVALLVVIVQLALGGWVSANYAGVACASFPQCMGDSWLGNSDFQGALQLWLPLGPNYEFGALDNPARQAINVLHRIGALVVTLVLGIWCLWLCKFRSVRRIALLTLALLFVQINLGVTNVIHHLPLHAAVSHNVMGALLLLAVITLNYKIYKLRKI